MENTAKDHLNNDDYTENHKESNGRFSHGISFVLSIFYGTLLVCLAVVFTASHYISSSESFDLVDYYLNVLYLISIVWWITFGISVRWGCNKADAERPIKSYHASNRWLKGVVALFAFSIAVKDTLEFIALSEITNPLCNHKALYILLPILHVPFVFGQVAFLFLYAKHYIQECHHLARFGTMHIMATNLSVWIATVAKEANDAYAYETQSVDNIVDETNSTTAVTATLRRSEESESPDYTLQDSDGLFHGNCTCATEYCKTVIEADKFLYPFLIEFCLVSTCLLYVSWRQVGRLATKQVSVVTPSYRFYKAYKGITFGGLLLAATITVTVMLGSNNSKSKADLQFIQSDSLHLYEGFLIISEFLNLLACVLGFYFYSQSKKTKQGSIGIRLDIVLLYVCFIGPLLVGLFSILSFCVGEPQSRYSAWWISLTFPFTDILTTIVQICFIIYGMQFIPHATALPRSKNTLENVDGLESIDQKSLHQLEEAHDAEDITASTCTCDTSLEMGQMGSCSKIITSFASDDADEVPSQVFEASSSKVCTQKTFVNLDSKAISRFELSAPTRVRIHLRDVIMFLVISNASIWIFLSLDKTVFSSLTYQHYYFGNSTWTTLTAITTPLSIFLRMHSAACLFEMWSYA